MYKNHIKLAFRNLYRNKTYTFLNVTGLSIGIICCILVSLYIISELSYDTHYKNADRIFRVSYTLNLNDIVYNEASVPFPAAKALENDFSAIQKSTRLYKNSDPCLIEYDGKKYKEEKFFFADEAFFSIFDYKFLMGNPDDVFKDPQNICITRSTAEKYFGTETPIGKVIEYEGINNLLISGVIEDPPSTSHFKFDFLAPLDLQLNIWKAQTGFEGREYKWFWTGAWTYVLLNNSKIKDDINSALPEFVGKYFPDRIKAGIKLRLQPLKDIHLYSDLDNEIEPNGSAMYLYTFSSIAFFVLLIACMNFVNLSTAYSLKRNKEIGVRKVLGASRYQLLNQVLSETIISIVISFILSIGMLEFILPFFNLYTGLNLSLHILGLFTWIFFFILLLAAITFLAGAYPAYFISKVNAVAAFRNIDGKLLGRESIRKILVIAQFAISISLLIFSGIVNLQIEFFQNKRLGFNKDNVLFIKARPEVTDKFQAFKNELLQYSGIQKISITSDIPGQGVNASRFIPEGFTAENPQMLPLVMVDEDFISAMSIKLKSGRNFSRTPYDYSKAFILNETAAKQLGWTKSALGKELSLFAPGTTEILKSGEVIGVVEDFHFESLHHQIKPLVLTLDNFYRYYIVKFTDSPRGVIGFINNKWKEFSPDWQLEYLFLKQNLAEQYAGEENMKVFINYFTLIAFIIASLGLFGLISYATRQRTKEIGIRKTLGASAAGIFIMFTKDIAALLLISNLIAWPVVYFIASKWLQSYAYRVEIGVFPFLIACLSAAVIAFITIGYQVIKASMGNPVGALKYE